MLRWKARLGKQRLINSSPMAHPSRRLFAGQRVSAFILLCIGIEIVWNGYTALVGITTP
jgi:hypothetical protein